MKAIQTTLIGVAILPCLALATTLPSGPQIGTDVVPFQPYHVTGADAGNVVCPVCKYGFEPGIQVWVHDISDKQVSFIAKNLENQLENKGLKNIRAFIVFVEPNSKSDIEVVSHLKKLAQDNNLKDLALIYVRSNVKSISDYKINLDPTVKSTLIAYNHRKTVDKVINVTDSETGKNQITKAVELAIKG